MIARWLAVGFVPLLLVTFAFRFIGSQLPTDSLPWIIMVLPFAMFTLTYLLLALFRVDPADRAEVAGIFALPGLLAGIYEINSFTIVFPNLDPSLHAEFAGAMFGSYAAAILAGVLSSRLQQNDDAA